MFTIRRNRGEPAFKPVKHGVMAAACKQSAGLVRFTGEGLQLVPGALLASRFFVSCALCFEQTLCLDLAKPLLLVRAPPLFLFVAKTLLFPGALLAGCFFVLGALFLEQALFPRSSFSQLLRFELSQSFRFERSEARFFSFPEVLGRDLAKPSLVFCTAPLFLFVAKALLFAGALLAGRFFVLGALFLEQALFPFGGFSQQLRLAFSPLLCFKHSEARFFSLPEVLGRDLTKPLLLFRTAPLFFVLGALRFEGAEFTLYYRKLVGVVRFDGDHVAGMKEDRQVERRWGCRCRFLRDRLAELLEELVEIEEFLDRDRGNIGGRDPKRRRDGLRDPIDGAFEVGIMTGQPQRMLVVVQRSVEASLLLGDFREPANRRHVVRRALNDDVQFTLGSIEFAEFNKGPGEGDARRQITGMFGETVAADPHRFVVVARPAALLRQLGKSDRRRVRLDPAPKFEDSLAVRHSG